MSRKRKSVEDAKAEVSTPPTNGEKGQNSIVTRSQAKKCRLSTEPESLSAFGTQEMQVVRAPATAQVVRKIAKKFDKHHVYWLPEGNTLVQIGGVRFKLEKSILVRHSEWFREMVANPQNNSCVCADEETGETVYCLDGLKVEVKDFVALLNALDNAVSFAYNSPSLDFVAAILRAADALKFNQFRAFAVSYLENKWLQDFEKFNGDPINYAADTVLLARRYNIHSVLKRAFYELVRSDGFKQRSDSDAEGDRNETGPVLDSLDYQSLVYAREQLTFFWMQKATAPKQQTCFSPGESPAHKRCAVTKDVVRVMHTTLVHDSNIFLKYRQDPIMGLQALHDAPWVLGETWPSTYSKDFPIVKSGHLCAVCAKKWRELWLFQKEMLWNNLDVWFRLENTKT